MAIAYRINCIYAGACRKPCSGIRLLRDRAQLAAGYARRLAGLAGLDVPVAVGVEWIYRISQSVIDVHLDVKIVSGIGG